MPEVRTIADLSVAQLIDLIIENWEDIIIVGNTKSKQKKYLLTLTPIKLLLLYHEIQLDRRANKGVAS